MGKTFQLSQYIKENYKVFRLETPEEENKNPDQMGFAIIELEDKIISCAHCGAQVDYFQTWWHNKLPYAYISGEEKGLNVHLCLDCALNENNNNISTLKNSSQFDDPILQERLIEQYEIENEQIEYYKIFKIQNERVSS